MPFRCGVVSVAYNEAGRKFSDEQSYLMYMRAFAEAWNEDEIVQQPVGQLPWGHNVLLLTRLKDRSLSVGRRKRKACYRHLPTWARCRQQYTAGQL